jgi:hypothetical protein
MISLERELQRTQRRARSSCHPRGRRGRPAGRVPVARTPHKRGTTPLPPSAPPRPRRQLSSTQDKADRERLEVRLRGSRLGAGDDDTYAAWD